MKVAVGRTGFEFDPDQPRDDHGRWSPDGGGGGASDASTGGGSEASAEAVRAIAQGEDPDAGAYQRSGDPEGQFGITSGFQGEDPADMPLVERITYNLGIFALTDDADRETIKVHRVIREKYGMNPDLSKRGDDIGTVAFGRDSDGAPAWRAFDIENKEIRPTGTMFYESAPDAVKAVLGQ